MLMRSAREEEQDIFNQAVHHPLQSWEWGDFRSKTGKKVERIGLFSNGKFTNALQVTFHPIPHFGKTVGYLPKGYTPDENQISALKQLAERNNALFIKIEPEVAAPISEDKNHREIKRFLKMNDCEPGRPLFTKYTFQLDLTKPEEELFENLDSKTRYNVRLADRKGVEIFENSTKEGLEQYIKILEETTKRQQFYAHDPDYFRKMWKSLEGSGMMKIFHAVYEDKILVSWIMFVFNNTLYYPYGASRNIHREVMASNLMMWEMIRFGQRQGCTMFDMWGSLGPNPDKKDSWYGFHRFKKGYGGTLVEFVGSYDLVMNKPLYKLFRKLENIRWKLLRLRAKLRI